MPKTDHEPLTRPPWDRMMRLHTRLQANRYPNCSTLAQELEVVPRTVMRDLEFMRDRLRLPIQFDRHRRGFHYTEPVDQFPHLAFSEAELFALLVAHKAIALYSNTPFQKPLASAFRRLIARLDSSAQYALTTLEQGFAFRPFAPEDNDLKNFEVLTRALKEHRLLKFQYRNLGSAKAQSRLVQPYTLGYVEGHWYLFAFDVHRQAIRTFALPRLRSPRLTPKRFAMPKDFNLNEYLKGSLSVFKGEEDYEIVVEFDPWAADLVRGRQWHASQEIIELPNRQLRLRLRLNNVNEAERWILSWGQHATVIRPEALARRLCDTTAAMHTRYQQQLSGAEPVRPLQPETLRPLN